MADKECEKAGKECEKVLPYEPEQSIIISPHSDAVNGYAVRYVLHCLDGTDIPVLFLTGRDIDCRMFYGHHNDSGTESICLKGDIKIC